MSEIQAVVRPFVEICALRRRPQDLPPSTLLLAIMLVAHTLSSVLLSSFRLDVGLALMAGVTDTLLVIVLTASLLYMHRRQARIVQTLSAMAGTGAIIMLAAIPLLPWLGDAGQNGGASPLTALLVLGFIAWTLGVYGHILRHALSIPYMLGILIALVFYWTSHMVVNSLFPLNA